MKLQHIYHTGANNKYFIDVLRGMSASIYFDRLDFYSRNGNRNVDILTYQTFPDENIPGKFNPKLVEQTDKLFNEFQGLKILVDSHDNGDRDAFSRFDAGIPRVKCFPSHRFERDYNVVLRSTFSVKDTTIFPDEFVRDIRISCKFGKHKYHHTIREGVSRQLGSHTPFFNLTSWGWEDGRDALVDSLRRTMISVCAPGHGQYSGAYQCTLRAGALLFAHRCLNDIHYLPHYDLKDGTDFVSYDLFNFPDELKRLINDPAHIHNVRMSGQLAFMKGYNVEQSADQFYNYLEEQLK